MENPTSLHGSSPRRSYSAVLAGAIATLTAVLIGVLAIDMQSFWIDELGTWRITQAPDWGTWLAQLLRWPTSDTQLFLYHLYMRIWSLFGPVAEPGWRWSNVPWLAITLWPLVAAPVARNVRSLLWVTAIVYACHPMTWYYVNELRPYVALTAGSTLAGTGVLSAAFPPGSSGGIRRGKDCLIVGVTLMSAVSPLGAIWAMGFLAAAAWLLWRSGRLGRVLDRHTSLLLLACVALLAPVFYHYLVTLMAGASATALYPHMAANFGFGLYELAGVSGLGPGRDELRTSGPQALAEYIPGLVAACAALGLVGLFGLRALQRRHGTELLVALACICLPLLALWILGSARSWRVVGRHMLPMLFVVNICLASGLIVLWKDSRTVTRTIAAIGVLVLLLSSLFIRHADRHEREVYSRAAAEAKDAIQEGGTVWWLADQSGLRFYAPSIPIQRSCLSASRSDVGGMLIAWENPSPAAITSCQAPTIAIVARREAYDQSGAAVEYLSLSGLHPVEKFIGFEIWR